MVHLKREAAPVFWPIHRKEKQWTTKPNSGPHPIASCMTLLTIARDSLKLVDTAKEAKFILGQSFVRVDGRARKDYRFPVGLMDVVEIQKKDKVYRALPSKRGLFLQEVPKGEAGFKLCRIEGKQTLRKGNIQLNLHDGRNLMVKVKNPMKPAEDVYKVNDVLKIALPDQKILDHLKFAGGSLALIIKGRYAGRYGSITDIKTGMRRSRTGNVIYVKLKDEQGKAFSTTADRIFIVGSKGPSISLPKR